MLKATTQPQTLRFYGKTNWGEFAWFVIFMGCLGLVFTFTLVSIFLGNPLFVVGKTKHNLRNIILFSIFFILWNVLISFILYWGFMMRWEYKDGGKNAVKDFWKKFWSGKVPRLADIRVEQPMVEDYLKQMGKYIEDLTPGEIGDAYVKLKKEFGDERYVIFDFYRGIMHVDVYVYIPVRIFEKLSKILDGRKYRLKRIGEKRYALIYEDGEKVEITDEDYEVLRFLEMLVKTQGENIKYIKRLKDELASGKLNLHEYIVDAYNYKFFGRRKG